MEIEVVMTIMVNGVITDDDKLTKTVLDTRNKMCKVVNSGWIDEYNKLVGKLGLDNIDYPAYQDCYISLTNEYWTKLIHENGYRNLRVIDEVLVPLKGFCDYYICYINLETI